MFRSLLEWWSGQHWSVRMGAAGAFLAVSTILLLLGVFWPWGWVVGGVLLIFGGPSDSEKKGYKF